MDYFTKNKMLFWGVLVLVALNVVTLSFFWFTRPQGPRGSRGGAESSSGQDVMEERLRFSAEQAQQLEIIRDNHFSRAEPLQDDMYMLRMDLLDELFAPESNQEEIERLLIELKQKSGQLEDELTRHFQDLKDLCDQRQAEELKFMLIEMTEQRRSRPPQESDRRPDGGFGPDQGRPRRY